MVKKNLIILTILFLTINSKLFSQENLVRIDNNKIDISKKNYFFYENIDKIYFYKVPKKKYYNTNFVKKASISLFDEYTIYTNITDVFKLYIKNSYNELRIENIFIDKKTEWIKNPDDISIEIKRLNKKINFQIIPKRKIETIETVKIDNIYNMEINPVYYYDYDFSINKIQFYESLYYNNKNININKKIDKKIIYKFNIINFIKEFFNLTIILTPFIIFFLKKKIQTFTLLLLIVCFIFYKDFIFLIFYIISSYLIKYYLNFRKNFIYCSLFFLGIYNFIFINSDILALVFHEKFFEKYNFFYYTRNFNLNYLLFYVFIITLINLYYKKDTIRYS